MSQYVCAFKGGTSLEERGAFCVQMIKSGTLCKSVRQAPSVCLISLQDQLMTGGSTCSYLIFTFLNNEKEATCWVCSLLINSLGAVASMLVYFVLCAVGGGGH